MEGIIFDVDAEHGLENNASSTWERHSLSDVVLVVEGWNYRISKVEASEPIPSSRSSVIRGTFAILMPPSGLRALVEDVEHRVEGSGSHTTELPFWVLVNILERPRCAVESGDGEVDNDIISVARREMVEFEIVLEDEEEEHDESGSDGEYLSDDIMGSEVNEEHASFMTQARILPGTQKWFVC